MTTKVSGDDKEGREETTMAAQVDRDLCTGCGSCVEACPVDAIRLEADTAVLDAETCTECGVCVSECPVEAISLP